MADSNLVAEELRIRRHLWGQVQAFAGEDIEPGWLRERGIYGGAQGIWVDKVRTAPLSSDGSGVTVSFLHTGRHYADELSSDGVVYHYPSTRRPPSRDAAEIQATKNAGSLGIPLFAILPGRRPGGRRVKLGWVADHDDVTRSFLILFGDEPVSSTPAAADAPFELFGAKVDKKALATVRPNQQRFRFNVLKQYGSKCAVCDITEPRLLKAAHICGKADSGSDDWRNGIPLCATHHDAFDAHMFGVHPSTLAIQCAPGVSLEAIGIAGGVLAPKASNPHQKALEWRWAAAENSWSS